MIRGIISYIGVIAIGVAISVGLTYLNENLIILWWVIFIPAALLFLRVMAWRVKD